MILTSTSRYVNPTIHIPHSIPIIRRRPSSCLPLVSPPNPVHSSPPPPPVYRAPPIPQDIAEHTSSNPRPHLAGAPFSPWPASVPIALRSGRGFGIARGLLHISYLNVSEGEGGASGGTNRMSSHTPLRTFNSASSTATMSELSSQLHWCLAGESQTEQLGARSVGAVEWDACWRWWCAGCVGETVW